MPLKSGSDQKTIGSNIAEFHHGATYERTKEKFGKATADRQAIAAAEENARRHPRRGHRPKTRLARM